MSITDELRAGGTYRFPSNRRVFTEEELTAIADRIDEQHAVTVERLEKYRAAVDAMLKEYVKLPVDADGVPIRVGDVMEERSGHTFEVASIMVFGGSGNQLVFSDARNFSSFREPHDLRHHHVPTVEDVLREFGAGWYEQMSGPETFDIDDYVERYAARLRLAGEDA